MDQIHKRFNSEQVRNLFRSYCQGLLDRDEIEDYLKSHLKWAGCNTPLFPKEIADEIYQRSHGLPRLINRIAYSCLMSAACAQKELVDGPCLDQALSEHLFTKTTTRKETGT